MDLKIEYIPVSDLKPYEKNARKHAAKDVEAIAASIREFGFDDPVGIWGDNLIVEGHGRLQAAKKLGMKKVPCIRLDHLSDEQRRAYALAHNRTAELSEWDVGLLDLELDDITDLDMSLFGFDMLRPEIDWNETRERWDRSREEGNDEYNEFLEKFEAKKTTDDCYTPDNVYDAVADWVAAEYRLDRKQFVRPFYPGGDYQHYKYGKEAVVVDNPPFSILAEIVDFYVEKDIKFFLFAPGLATLNYVNRKNVCAVCSYAQITYENGATVVTSFLTNLGDGTIIALACPELNAAIEEENDKNEAAMRVHMPKYEYPVEVLTAAKLGWLAKYGQRVAIKRDECAFIRQLDAMKESGKGIFGNALLLSERAAAERAAAERAAAQVWQLSEREKEIVQQLGN